MPSSFATFSFDFVFYPTFLFILIVFISITNWHTLQTMLSNALPTNDTFRANSSILRRCTSYESYRTLQINKTTRSLLVSEFIDSWNKHNVCKHSICKLIYRTLLICWCCDFWPTYLDSYCLADLFYLYLLWSSLPD